MTIEEPPVREASSHPVDVSDDDEAAADEEFIKDIVGVEKKLTEDGCLKKTILTAGTDLEQPEDGDEVSVHYVGTLLDGTKFDSSRDRGDPFVFKLGQGQVIKGWDKGVATMRRGEKALLVCGPDYAYGAAGAPPKIPSNATLQFEVELLSWKSQRDLTGDGGVLKKVVKAGQGWKRPGAESEVCVTYTAYLKDFKAPFAETGAQGVKFSLSEGHLCYALEIALKAMKQGERVQLHVSDAYGCRDAFARPDVPVDSALVIDLQLLSWMEVVAVTSDRKVMKKVLNGGELGDSYNKPKEDGRVEVRCVGTLADGTKFVEDTRAFIVGEEEVVAGLELAVQKMQKGEKALVTIEPPYGFGDVAKQEPLADVPAGSTLAYELELLDFENPKDSWQMSTDEKLATSKMLKEAGNELFKQGKNERALKKYDKAVSLVERDAGLDDAQKAEAFMLKKSCWLNQAAAQLKLRRYREAITTASKVLEQERNNVKALYRRADAHTGLEDFEEAILDLTHAQEAEPANRDVAVKLKRAKQLQAASNKQQAKLYGNMFTRMAKLEEKELAMKGSTTAAPAPDTSSADQAS